MPGPETSFALAGLNAREKFPFACMLGEQEQGRTCVATWAGATPPIVGLNDLIIRHVCDSDNSQAGHFVSRVLLRVFVVAFFANLHRVVVLSFAGSA